MSRQVHWCRVTLRFIKYEGLGNDFLVLDASEAPPIDQVMAARLCDRNFGVGGDGVLLTGRSNGRPYMRVINADGSRPEMCGNGLRCVALYWVHRGAFTSEAFEIDTDAGPHVVEVTRDVAHGGSVKVGMRHASLAAADVLRDAHGQQIDQAFDVDGRALRLTAVSMGNPHAVFFDEVGEDAALLGPRIERDPRFSAGANVGFAQMTSANALKLRVWERGVGFTLACGTGACAAAVAAVETGRAARGEPITVTLPGGALVIRVSAPGERIEMIGPARRVFTGELCEEPS